MGGESLRKEEMLHSIHRAAGRGVFLGLQDAIGTSFNNV